MRIIWDLPVTFLLAQRKLTLACLLGLPQVIDDVANMGFSRHEVHSVIAELMDIGQSVDLNVVLDRLMNGPRR